ncbi:MAG: stage V sporulation protein AD [Clostridium sp.]|uniref:stage V sporulation protein AD n=1 Tax=unclassified Clostridium TaxID=2614128 RepID=UPI000E4CAC26|nr:MULTISPECIES: stage V sporulation protein AD [unclassified Clostridium]MBS6767775.1 stage V sporulation protein AD [Clostridium sp.]RHV21754.1 stage V sporulation protein AD [Clostridium sp. OM05-6BH]HCK45157.1 stage V sporulation protein AD [Lachnospiraceae bacterium]RHQ13610.1 stage V sporulation protein AD [Clostridium sp. AM49-4BH]RHV17608.1 stage V sporulation protein AD [Clostridium sp. OM05-9BH]
MKKQQGIQSVKFEEPPIICAAASVVGQKEGDGPFGDVFDQIESDPKVGGDTWEDAEGRLQERAAELAIQKAGCGKEAIRYIVAGDLLGQLMASSFGLAGFDKPLFGVYGACSTMGESIGIGSMLVEGGFADYVLAMTSSHFASAEKQFRFPLGYANQRPKASTWTVTGSGAVVICKGDQKQGMAKITGITTGKIVDYGVKDTMNMGACMAPAAASVVAAHFKDFGTDPSEYDQIITGDLGMVGKDILIDILRSEGYDIADRYIDCGIEIYGRDAQAQAGGSGCGCSAVMLAGYVLKQLEIGEWKRVLFVPTGALLSVVSFNEGNSIPGIAHAVRLETLISN